MVMTPSTSLRCLLSFLPGLVLSCLLLTQCRADVPPPIQEPPNQPSSAELERLVNVGVVLFFLVLTLGVLMMAAVLVWGIRTRRITGQKLPNPTADDPLWYLKPGEERAALPPESVSDETPADTSHDAAD